MTATMTGDQQNRDWASQIHTLLANNPDGMKRDDLMAACQPPIPDVNTFHVVKGILQDRLGSTQITVVGDSRTAGQGVKGGWTYSLQGDPEHPIARRYSIYKLRRIFAFQRRSYVVSTALANGINGRTAVGRAANRVRMQNRRTMEDIADALTELGVVPPAIPA